MKNNSAVLAALPLALLQSTRAHDRPGEVLEDEDVSASLPRRLGLSGVIATQIHRYETAAKSGKRVPSDEFNNLLKLMLRRPDAEAILRETGARIAQRQFESVPPWWLKILRVMPKALMLRSIRAATTRLLRNIAGTSDIAVTGTPLHARIRDPQTPRMEPAGVACALYASAFEEISSLYLGRKTRVQQVRCVTDGGGYCDFQLET